MDVDELKSRLYSVRERIARASGESGHEVTLVAATKTVPAEIIDTAVSLGITSVGENRVQEFVAKRELVTGAEWHFIGTLQRNKAKYLVGKVKLIQSVSSLPLAEEIARLAAKLGIVQDVLIEVNAADEPSKTGASMSEASELIEKARTLKGIRVRGLMAIPPKDAADATYRKLLALYESQSSQDFDILSVGMSGDFERAIAFGSNMVRLGTAIFGDRNSHDKT